MKNRPTGAYACRDPDTGEITAVELVIQPDDLVPDESEAEKKNPSAENATEEQRGLFERHKNLYEKDYIEVGEKITYTAEFINMRFSAVNVWLDKTDIKATIGLVSGIGAMVLSLLTIILR